MSGGGSSGEGDGMGRGIGAAEHELERTEEKIEELAVELADALIRERHLTLELVAMQEALARVMESARYLFQTGGLQTLTAEESAAFQDANPWILK